MSTKLQTTSNALGIALEKGIVILCFVRGLIKNLKNYQLEYQVPEAEKFDDVVFHTGNGQILLIQLKNKEDGTLKLDHLDLFKNKFGEPFNLLKYVKSVIDMNKTNKFRDKIDMAVVYTNIDLDVNHQDMLSLAKYPKPWFGRISSIRVKRVNLPSNSILQFPNSNAKFYKFTDDPNTLQILEEQTKFLHNENLKIIANRLKKQIADLTADEILDQLERLKLTNFDITRNEIEEALKSVIYAVAQPSVEQLTSIIKTDIKTHFCIENVDDIYNSLDVKIGNWYNKSNLVAFCRDYINQANFIHRPYFIFTSRRKKCFSQISELELSVFTKTEAEMFLKTEFMKIPGLKWNKKDTRKLASTLRYFPLALQQAARKATFKRAVDECTSEQILHMVLIVKHLRQSSVWFQYKNYDKLCKAICNKAFQLTTSIKHDPHADKSFTVSKLFMDNYAEMDVFKLFKRKPVDELKKFIDSVKVDRDNLPPFFVICTWNRLDMVKYMIEIGVNINQKNEHGETPLLYSLRFQIETVQAKFKKKTMITVYYKLLNYCTNMMDAYFDILTFLIENGAKVNSSDLRSNTPLHIAMKCDYIKISEYLIESGADVNAKNMKGYTPLHIAAKYKKFKNVELLIEKGADITIESEEGLTPLNMTTNKNIDDLIRGTYFEPLITSSVKSYILKALVHLVLYPLVLICYERLQRYSEENWNFFPIPDWLIVILSMVAYSIAYCFLTFYYKNRKLFRKYEFI
uniref:CSON006606 protein n=1 Tax=Culicoides sonorensis TaxID=179676 RepID=A0A336KDM9_CULSO